MPTVVHTPCPHLLTACRGCPSTSCPQGDEVGGWLRLLRVEARTYGGAGAPRDGRATGCVGLVGAVLPGAVGATLSTGVDRVAPMSFITQGKGSTCRSLS